MRRGGVPSNSLRMYKGIRQKKSGKWVAEFCIPPESRIKGSKPREWLGTFATLEEAVEAYNQKSISVCGTPAYSLDHYASVLRTPCTLPSNQFLLSPPPANQQTSSCTTHQMHMGSYSNSQLWQTSPVLAADIILERREVPPTEKLFSVPIDWLMSSYVPPDIHQLSAGVNSTDNHQLSTGLNGASFQGEKSQAPTWARTEASTFRVDGGGMSVLEEPGTDPISLTAENKDSSEEIRIQDTYDVQNGETPWVDGETGEALKTYRKSWKPKENQVSIPSGKEGPAEKLTTRDAELDLSTLWMMVEDEDWGSYELRRLCQSKTGSDIPSAATATNGSSSNMVPGISLGISAGKDEQVNASNPTEERLPMQMPDETATKELRDILPGNDNQMEGTTDPLLDFALDDVLCDFKLESLFEHNHSFDDLYLTDFDLPAFEDM
ncbi:hypothetical protein R1sor_025713 [Riccia sorocarpa]|uniref:AP2/ERF domain-containing protein n=1 Tax=Riccia sorocarpa TaxID=122646 RepID=A0ABD3G9F9_9MARC